MESVKFNFAGTHLNFLYASNMNALIVIGIYVA